MEEDTPQVGLPNKGETPDQEQPLLDKEEIQKTKPKFTRTRTLGVKVKDKKTIF